MKERNECILRIPEEYVHENYVQLTFSFKKSIMLFCAEDIKNGLLCYYNFNNNEENINSYLKDKNRKFFPYSNIPMYKGGCGKYFVNQILEFNKHYILMVDGAVRNLYGVHKDKEAFVLNRKIRVSVCSYYQCEKISDIFNPSLKFLFDFTGDRYSFAYSDGKLRLFPSDIKDVVASGGGLFVYEDKDSYRRINCQYIAMKRYFDNVNMCYREDFVNAKVYTIPFNNYLFEDLKLFGTKFRNVKTPNVSLIMNPNIDKNEILIAKKKIKKH